MRLRLEVLRNQLPATRIIWQAAPEETAAEFVHNLDAFVPLQSQDWGLEDYVIENEAGFEALHFHTIGAIFKDDELVRVRPLSTRDIRARILAGRDQIHPNGAHLLDGVMWGRPLLRKPVRPVVDIASRERLGYGSSNAADSLPLYDTQLQGDSEDDDDDMDYHEEEQDEQWSEHGEEQEEEEAGADDLKTLSAGSTPRRSSRLGLTSSTNDSGNASKELVVISNDDRILSVGDGIVQYAVPQVGGTPSGEQKGRKRKRATKQVHWDEEVTSTESHSSPDGPAEAGPSASDGESDSDFGSDSGSEESSSSDEDSSVDMDPSPVAKRRKTTTGASGKVSTPSVVSVQPTVAPGQGKNSTKKRNARRKLTNKLIYLKSRGILPQDAGIPELRSQLSGTSPEATDSSGRNILPGTGGPEKGEVVVVPDDEESDMSESESESEDSSSSDSESSSDDTDEKSDEETLGEAPEQATTRAPLASVKNHKGAEEMQERRKALLEQLAAGGIDVTETPSNGTPNGTPKTNGTPTNGDGAESAQSPSEEAAPERKKKQLDVKASQRLLLGSLGHRAPRTAAERETLVSKLKEELRKPVKPSETASVAANEHAEEDAEALEDPDYWKKHIELTAVECVDVGVELTKPPFPYYHGWSPGYPYSRKKRKHRSQQQEEYDDSYVEDEADDSLDYGDEYDAADSSNIAVARNNRDATPDLPPLPEDLSVLDTVLEAELKPGDIIVFTTLEVSAATNWTPAMSQPKTAKVLGQDLVAGQPIQVRLAKRDLPEKRYDDEGKRVYEKFEMDGDEDDGAEGEVDLNWEDVIGPRLLAQEGTA